MTYYKADFSFCGLYEIEGYIFKNGLGNSTRQSIHIYDEFIKMPEDINSVINLNRSINKGNGNIIAEVDVPNNLWMKCPGTRLSIEINWDKCTKEDEESGSITKKYPPIDLEEKDFIKDIKIDLGNDYAYGTRFTVIYSITKTYNGITYTKTASSGNNALNKELLDVVKFLGTVQVDKTSIIFDISRPFQCYTSFDINCTIVTIDEAWQGISSSATLNNTDKEKIR